MIGWVAAAVVILLVASAKKSGPAAGFSTSTRPLSKRGVLDLLKSDAELAPVRVYRGFPQTMKIPPGYGPIEVWEGAQPNPHRFVQWHAIGSQPDDEVPDLQERFSRLYWFGTSEADGTGTSLKWWVLGKRTSDNAKCCSQVLCTMEDEWSQSGLQWEDEHMFKTQAGGSPTDWYRRLGPAWSCRCQGFEQDCFELVPAPKANWPLATEAAPMGLKGFAP